MPNADPVATAVRRAYRSAAARAGGVWNAAVSVGDAAAVLVGADEDVQAYSVNKVAVAVAVLDRVDRGRLSLGERVEVTESVIVPGGDGIFALDGAYPSSVTLGHVLAALLTVSDDTALRLCGQVVPPPQINEILAEKGFGRTRVDPVPDTGRFFLGTTTARDTHDLLAALAAGSLLSAGSTRFLLGSLRSPIAYADGIRRMMSSQERARVATKAGWYADGRNEAGIVFDAAGSPALIYALFARGQAYPEDFGATHPAVHARAAMGRRFLSALTERERQAQAAPRPRGAPQPRRRPRGAPE